MTNLPPNIRIDFGWELDAVASTGKSLNQVTVGPSGLIALLATRLGMSGADENEAQRVLRYHQALKDQIAENPNTWYAESFSVNPWGTARKLLALRDFLARYGWQPVENISPDASERLRAINALELALAREPGWLTHFSSMASAVAQRLEEMAGDPARAWPLGIGSIRLHACAGFPAEESSHSPLLPDVYQNILASLKALGVEVQQARPQKNLKDFRLYSAATEWEAATVAARIMASRADSPTAVLAGSPTDILDRELTRRNIPQLGARTAENRDVVGIFLAAISQPHDVRSLLDFLLMSFPSMDRTRRCPVVSPGVTGAFIEALSREPGVGGPAWKAAVARFDVGPEGEDPSRRKARASNAELARTLDDMVRGQFEGQVLALDLNTPTDKPLNKDLVIDRLKWLKRRLNSITRVPGSPAQDAGGEAVSLNLEQAAEGSAQQVSTSESGTKLTVPAELQAALNQVTTVIEVLTSMPDVTSRVLMELVKSTVDSGRLRLSARAANPQVVAATAPAALEGQDDGFLLWWAPFDETVNVDFPLIDSELETVNSQGGFSFPTAQGLARLTLVAQQSAIEKFSTVLAVYPETRAGETVHEEIELASLVSFIWQSAHEGQGPIPEMEPTPVDSFFSDPRPAVQDEAHTVLWRLDGEEPLPVSLPAATEFEVPDEVEFEVNFNADLLPEALSHSQMTKLLSRPFEWLLEYPLQVKEADSANVPTGNRMVGTFMHRIAEEIFREQQGESSEPVLVVATPELIGQKYDELLPIMAAELQLPGSLREKNLRREEVVESLSTFFALLAEQDIRISAMEAPLGDQELGNKQGFWLDIPVGSGEHRVLVNGYQDVVVQLPGGDGKRRGVIDLKYSGSSTQAKKFPGYVEKGEATQLATYAAAVENAGLGQAMDDVPLGYFLLKQAQMHSASEEFQGALETSRSTSELWNRLIRHLGMVFEDLQEGRVYNIDTYRTELKQRIDVGVTAKGRTKEAIALKKEQARQIELDDLETRSEGFTQRLQAVKDEGFYPTNHNQYPNYSTITGPKGDLR
ncbi:PD-(D/E)XK nuclease family protein [Rothia nasimurium]|uniref:PD-(D/E)XK nuclease family protein n=1 Tax=Rothia nasimurium TaxID=85336 RepID=UPI001F32683D|nr:PD-(D/E)XK nuclease family protein [Rothia nasimurium]